jgi:protein TonB
MPFHVDAPKVLMPVLPKAPIPVRVEQASTASGPSLNVVANVVAESSSRRLILSQFPTTNDAPALVRFGPGMTGPDAMLSGISNGHGPAVTVVPVKPAPGPLHVSTGVSEGMLIAPIRPVYPPIAKAAGVQGTVVVEAIISRTGTIESLHVVSGPPMLQVAALDAIREARYRPFRLNGEPTQVQTTITVNFRMGG